MRYFKNKISGLIGCSNDDDYYYANNKDWVEVIITEKPKPVSGTVAIIRRANGIYEAEKGRLLINGDELWDQAVPKGDEIVARLTWTEGQGL